MASDSDQETPIQDHIEASNSQLPARDDGHDDGSSDGEAEFQASSVEWLATGRQKRVTAGNRMKSMLANEEPEDSDLELLFAEDEDDHGFSDGDADASDVHMDSSSDEEDDHNGAADDMEGERELEQQAKERHAAQRKRKAQEAIPVKFRKKVRIDPSIPGTSDTPGRASTPRGTSAPAPRPKKKSERASWLPASADMPTRASSRSTTRESKKHLHAQMKEREARRLKQVRDMQKKAAEVEALRKPPMTQADRLAEAALVEKRNSKSLDRWEEAEKQREEERRRKLAALNERTLKGPVLTFWSGRGGWEDGLPGNIGNKLVEVMEEKVKKPKKEKDKQKAKNQDGNITVEMHGNKGESTDDKTKDIPNGIEAHRGEGSAKIENTRPVENEPPELGGFGEKKDDGKSTNSPMGEAQVKLAAEDGVGSSKAETAGQPSARLSPSKETGGDTPANSLDVSDQSSQLQAASATSADRSQPHEGTTSSEEAHLKPDVSMSEASHKQPDNTKSSKSPPRASELRNSAPEESLDKRPSDGEERSATPAATASQPSSIQPLSAEISKDGRPQQAAESIGVPLNDEISHSQANASLIMPVPPATQFKNEPYITQSVFQPIEDGSTSASPNPIQKAENRTASTATRNAVIYQSFDDNLIRDKQIQTQILFGRKMTKLPKPALHPLCVITNLPARYKDPETNLPFHNSYAYRQIQNLKKGDYKWSKILGVWVGNTAIAARGVPERFTNPNALSSFKKQDVGDAKPAVTETKERSENDASVLPNAECKVLGSRDNALTT